MRGVKGCVSNKKNEVLIPKVEALVVAHRAGIKFGSHKTFARFGIPTSK